MAEPRSRLFDGQKFMWDGRQYEAAADAVKAKEEYENKGFETRILEEDDQVQLYTRRVVTEVIVDGAP